MSRESLAKFCEFSAGTEKEQQRVISIDKAVHFRSSANNAKNATRNGIYYSTHHYNTLQLMRSTRTYTYLRPA